ncbi:PREDICTED: synaptic vesicular amine transporter [Ceratosolen solmsi marchali]|uniref:Synaptic vesicular amine transporter n=1 Tax=Ceratosolen solmsi marchali TaxID=326594 RepID=A0AAJ6YJQ1_9HYME|nr:PREDICTED: synaptic vesicular amine transporter [Ceratosolen solmsi marchali]
MYETKSNTSRFLLVTSIYLSLLLDNILLTVVVPIIPDYLYTLEGNLTLNGAEKDENGRVGLLLSSKAFVQLILNPAVGSLTGIFGYAKPLLLGNLSLLLAALLFALGKTYEILFLARSIQGVSSACIAVSGMSLVAFQYPEEDKRSKVMGFVLGSIAMGVLAGYPMGSVLYDLEGKMAPFLLIACFIVFLIGFQLFVLDLNHVAQRGEGEPSWRYLLLDTRILIIAGAIWFSTTPMAILEPCLPIWLRSHLKPKKWQLGTVFIPDSVGYLIGTNFFGVIAYCYGRCKTAVLAMLLVGLSAIAIPVAASMSQLIIPHLGLGLGIGVADAALVPLLASFVESSRGYGPVYSIQQIAVSLAYSLGPIVSGELVNSVGFPWVMRVAGLANIAYCSLLMYLALERRKNSLVAAQYEKKEYNSFKILNQQPKYERFYDSDDGL